MDHRRAPLYEALVRHAESGAASFHVPGHKSGQGIPSGAEPYYRSLLRLDLTELPGLDDLHEPREAILEAERLAAAAFGAEHTFFLVGGSTVGNLAGVLSVCGPGDVLLVQRDAHQSVLNGLMLAGAQAVFIRPRLCDDDGLSLGLHAEDVEAALHAYPQAKGVFITSPTYYGRTVPVEPLAELAHRRGVPLIVDEAHGAHFAFHRELPRPAIAAGADIVVQSAHKMLAAMTMGAMLHVRGDRVDPERLRRLLAMLQSSSPSYPIMASLDLCRRDIVLHGEARIGQALESLSRLRESFRRAGPIRALPADERAGTANDPFKLALIDTSGALSGFELYARLAKRGCYAELADPAYALLAFSPYSSENDMLRLREAVAEIGAGLSTNKQELAAWRANIHISSSIPTVSDPVTLVPPHRQPERAVRRLPRDCAAGWPSADMITPYPPGIPLVFPGERLTPQMIDYLERLHRQGARIHGLRDPGLHTLAVLDMPR